MKCNIIYFLFITVADNEGASVIDRNRERKKREIKKT